jgi:hypothetical protein
MRGLRQDRNIVKDYFHIFLTGVLGARACGRGWLSKKKLRNLEYSPSGDSVAEVEWRA